MCKQHYSGSNLIIVHDHFVLGSMCFVVLIVLLSACALSISSPLNPEESQATSTGQPQRVPSKEPSDDIEDPLESMSATKFIYPGSSWKTNPIIPDLSLRAFEIYQNGLALGSNPHAFSKVGDGEIASNWFLNIYALKPENYNLGPHSELAAVIDYFAGSFARMSLAARVGFNTTRILDPLFAMNDVCEVEETPLECELRHHRPSFAIISLGTNQVWTPELFETELRQIVEICIRRGVLPILSTKGDNLEGDHHINVIIADVAREYEIPLWNFWLAIQSLPDQGLQLDGEHLTWAENDFSDPEVMSHAWPNRNLTALKLLQRLMLELGSL